MEYLDFKTARCKDCFKCLRECPVKAIKIENHQAHIVEERCILCGTCTSVCPQNAKKVNSETAKTEAILSEGGQVIASVAPSFVSSFGVQNFSVLRLALTKLGFTRAEETAVGAKSVSAAYARILETREYKNFITSACPAINRMIQAYYPKALKYLAPVVSPMIAHGKLLKARFPDAKIVFIGPCIAKKREAAESGIIDAVLTFEELSQLFTNRNVGESRPIVGESRPIVGESRPIVGDSRAIVGEPRPIVGESRPIVGESRATVGESRPIVGDSRAIVGESRAIVGESRAIVGESPAIVGESRPIVGESRPIVGESRPIVGESRAMVSDIKAIFGGAMNRAKYYPISRGIIKSFINPPDGYEYVAVDGVKRCFELLEDIEAYSGLFIEMNCCEYACINGPCILKNAGGAIKANKEIRDYVNKNLLDAEAEPEKTAPRDVDLSVGYPPLPTRFVKPSERDIRFILAKSGKTKPEDELNCGACGYSTCREKALAVFNGLAAIEMCIPYMRTRAESMSYEIIQNSPNGIILLDSDYKIQELNGNARKILGITATDPKGLYAFDCFNCSEYLIAFNEGKSIHKKKVFIDETGKYAEVSIILLQEHKIMFGVYKDISDKVEFERQLIEVKNETLNTTDGVIKKQMRVAQEIASLLGETTAETKVALLKLKKTLLRESEDA
ncbi:MAG: 4Fe-4S binding protein [Treponema sp.]|jgi:iron only hydrogenase large subunit-like protein/uncharacterized Fe-S cluster-containing protein|nr:4Fe-4S binding protein [Treponema sp.]